MFGVSLPLLRDAVLVSLHLRKVELRSAFSTAVFCSELSHSPRREGTPAVAVGRGRSANGHDLGSNLTFGFYSRRHEGKKDGECMAGHRSAGLSEFGFNALP